MNEVSRNRYLIVAILFFEYFLLGCAMTDHNVTKPITKIVYSFKDASVPPQYHRSYTISVTRDQSHIIVDSYGDIVADVTIDIPEQTIGDLARYIEKYQIKESDRKSDTAIWTGGTSKSLKVYSDKDILLNGMVYQHGERLEGSLSGDIESFTKKLEGLFPDFPNLLK
jgi:hypothetical protein